MFWLIYNYFIFIYKVISLLHTHTHPHTHLDEGEAKTYRILLWKPLYNHHTISYAPLKECKDNSHFVMSIACANQFFFNNIYIKFITQEPL